MGGCLCGRQKPDSKKKKAREKIRGEARESERKSGGVLD